MWTLAEALVVVRDLQPKLKPLAWHVALGGGVLNNGASEKDLDLYILGFANEGGAPPTDPVLDLLRTLWGEPEPINEFEDEYVPAWFCREMVKFSVDGRRIDVFVQ